MPTKGFPKAIEEICFVTAACHDTDANTHTSLFAANLDNNHSPKIFDKMLHSCFPKVIVEAQSGAPINDEEATESDTQWLAKSTQRDTAEQLSHFAAMILVPFASLVPCDKFPIGLTRVVPVNVNLDYGHMLDTCYYCHTKACASLYYASEAIIWTIPFCSCVDNWFDTGQYFGAASYVLLTVESADLKQIEGFAPFITQTELGSECGESVDFFSFLVDQLSVSLVPADFWDVATHKSVNNGVKLFVCQVLGGTQISVVPHEHLERDMPTREGDRHYDVCSALCKVLLEDENGSSTGEFNDQCILGQFPFNPAAKFLIVTIYATASGLSVWDPGISFVFLDLTDSVEYVAVLPLLECISSLCFIAYSNSKTKVWDPGQLWFVKSYNLQSPFALSVTTLPSLGHFYIADWICVWSQAPLAIALPGSYSYADANQSFLLCSPKIAFLPLVTNSSGELILAKDDIELLRNINCKSTRVAILGDMLELGPTEYMYNELMLQLCCDAHLNVVALVGTRFFTAVENINCADEIKLVCTNDAHCMASEIINYLINGDGIHVQGSSQRQLGVTLAFVNFIFPIELCRAIVRKNKSTESSLLSSSLWKMSEICASTLGGDYMSSLHQVSLLLSGCICNNILFGENCDPKFYWKALLNKFFTSNLSLMLLKVAMILCGQGAMLQNPMIIILLKAITTLATGLERIGQEAQVKCDSLPAKILTCCLRICGDMELKVVNTTVATISCPVDKVVIVHIFSFYFPEHFCLETFGGECVANTILGSNLEDKVLF